MNDSNITSEAQSNKNRTSEAVSRANTQDKAFVAEVKGTTEVSDDDDESKKSAPKIQKNYTVVDTNPKFDFIPGPTYERPETDDENEEDSQDEHTIERTKNNKKHLLAWLTEADFRQEINLKQLLEHPFKLEHDEVDEMTTSYLQNANVLKM